MKKKRKGRDSLYNYSVNEEIANSITHGAGTLLSVAELAVLIVFAVLYGNLLHLFSFMVFGLSATALYLSSTLYHSLSNRRAKKFFKVLDHVGIYLLIAGTYTPLMLVGVGGLTGWLVFAIIWAMAVIGTIVKIHNVFKYQRFSLLLYLIMGWMCIFIFRQMVANLSTAALVMLISGGLLYTGGVIFYVWDRLPHNHAIWHLFVLGGSTCHFFAILFSLVLPVQ